MDEFEVLPHAHPTTAIRGSTPKQPPLNSSLLTLLQHFSNFRERKHEAASAVIAQQTYIGVPGRVLKLIRATFALADDMSHVAQKAVCVGSTRRLY